MSAHAPSIWQVCVGNGYLGSEKDCETENVLAFSVSETEILEWFSIEGEYCVTFLLDSRGQRGGAGDNSPDW